MSTASLSASFELQPTLESSLVKLRPLESRDFESLYAVSSDPLVWEQHPHSDRYKREVFEEFFEVAMESRGALLALDAKTGETIGSSRFWNLDPERDRVEIGYTFLARRCWGHTYNRDMKRLMIDHAFRFVSEVVFVIGRKNTRSQIAIGKVGATLRDEVIRDSVVYGLTRAQWRAHAVLRVQSSGTVSA